MDYRFFELKNLQTKGETALFAKQICDYAHFIEKRLLKMQKKQIEDTKRFWGVIREAHAVYHLRCLALEKLACDHRIFAEKKAILLALSFCRLMSIFMHLDLEYFQNQAYSTLEEIPHQYDRFTESLVLIWSSQWDHRVKPCDVIFWRMVSATNHAPMLFFHEDIFLNHYHHQTWASHDTPNLNQEITLTNSQTKALHDLTWLYKAWQRRIKIATIAPAMHALILGSSGSGKSFLVQRFAEQRKLSLFSTSLGAWIVLGGRSETPTMKKISGWVKGHYDGIIFIDELEKLNSKNAYSEYSKFIIDEVMSLLDGRVENLDGWDKAAALALKNYFIITSATYQDYYNEKIGKEGLHFAEQWESISIRDKILEQDRLPQELIFRLSSKIIEIAPPSAEEIASRIQAIHNELQLPELTPEQAHSVAQKIVKNKKNMRGVEEYALEKWIQHAKKREQNQQGEEKA